MAELGYKDIIYDIDDEDWDKLQKGKVKLIGFDRDTISFKVGKEVFDLVNIKGKQGATLLKVM
jgi:hypothetical protein